MDANLRGGTYRADPLRVPSLIIYGEENASGPPKRPILLAGILLQDP